MGLEPTTFELEVQHASPLRHGGCMSMTQNISWLHLFFFSPKITLFFHLFLILFGCWLDETKVSEKFKVSVNIVLPSFIFVCSQG